MSNIKEVRIAADVPFDYLSWKPDGEGLTAEAVAVDIENDGDWWTLI